MNIKKLRKRSSDFHRKQRRKLYLLAYKELKKKINSDSKRGKCDTYLMGKYRYEYAVAARLFYRKNKDFYVKIQIEETEWDERYLTTEIKISWDACRTPAFEEVIYYNIESEDE